MMTELDSEANKYNVVQSNLDKATLNAEVVTLLSSDDLEFK